MTTGSLAVPAGEPVSLRDRVYVDLGKKLMTGDIDHRTRLVESQLCETLNVSRTPLREALVRLHADGMLERRQDGYYPVALDIEGVRDLYELRITIELRGVTRILDNRRIRLIRMYDFVTTERVMATIAEHLEIVDLLLLDDLEAGRKALHERVGASFEVVERRALRALSARSLGHSVTSFDALVG